MSAAVVTRRHRSSWSRTRPRHAAWCALTAAGLLACGGEAPPPADTTPMLAVADGAHVGTPPVIRGIVFQPGRAAPGETTQAIVTASDADGDAVQFRYAWRVDGRPLVGNDQTVRVPENAAGAVVEVTVVASDGHEESEPARAHFRTANRAPRLTALDIESIEIAGPRGDEPHWRVLAEVVDPDRDRTSVRYEWLIGERVVASDVDHLAKRRAQRGDEVRVRATAFDGQVHSDTLQSPPIVIGNASPRIVSAPPDLDASGTFRYTPDVDDPDGDHALRFRLLDGPESMQIDAGTGELVWQPTVHDAGAHAVSLEVADPHGGRSRQTFSVRVDVGGAAPVPAAPAR